MLAVGRQLSSACISTATHFTNAACSPWSPSSMLQANGGTGITQGPPHLQHRSAVPCKRQQPQRAQHAAGISLPCCSHLKRCQCLLQSPLLARCCQRHQPLLQLRKPNLACYLYSSSGCGRGGCDHRPRRRRGIGRGRGSRCGGGRSSWRSGRDRRHRLRRCSRRGRGGSRRRCRGCGRGRGHSRGGLNCQLLQCTAYSGSRRRSICTWSSRPKLWRLLGLRSLAL